MTPKSLIIYVKLGAYLLVTILFIVIPTSFFESEYSLCVIKNIFGIECPGCGMTRAISCVFHRDFIKAFEYNKSVVIVFPLLCYSCLKNMLILFRSLKYMTIGA